MSEINRAELLKALRTISSVCVQQKVCNQCPLGDDEDNCLLRNLTPDGWCIKDEVDSVWRAFQ